MLFFTKDQTSALSSGTLPVDLRAPVDTSETPLGIPQPLSRQESLRLLQESLFLIPASNASPISKHTIFISIDIEGGHRTSHAIHEVGVSVLNTAHLSAFSSHTTESPNPIQSRNFSIRSRGGKFKPPKPFIFGDSEEVQYQNLPDLFRRIVLGEKARLTNPRKSKNPAFAPIYEHEGNGVNVVLVGHSLEKDFIAIEKLVPGIFRSGVITAIIDLSVLHGKIKLATLLEHLGIGQNVKERWLHFAGNDSNYTLRAVLLSALRELEIEIGNEGGELDWNRKGRGDIIRQIAIGGIPDLVREEGCSRRRKTWRLRKRQEGDEGGKELCGLNIDETLDNLGVGWCDFIFEQEMG